MRQHNEADDMNEPRIDDWYRDSAGRLFQVVDIDDIIVLQILDGPIEEIKFDDWRRLATEAVDGPDGSSPAPRDISSGIIFY